MDKEDVGVYTVYYYSAIKEMLTFVTTADLEEIMLSEISNTKDKYHIISLIYGTKQQSHK